MKETLYLQSYAIERAKELMELDYQVSYYRDMHNGHRVWIVEWKN